MRLALLDINLERRRSFDPLCLSRPVWELRCGMTTLGAKLAAKFPAAEVAYFVPEYMASAYAAKAGGPVNDRAVLADDDLLLVNGRLKADALDVAPTGPSEIALSADGEVLYARIARADLAPLADAPCLTCFLMLARELLPTVRRDLATWNYTWDLILANADQIKADFAAAARHGIEGTLEQPGTIRGSQKDVYVAPGARIHPMVVLDAEHGPIYIDEGAEIHPFTRIEGPCYVGAESILLGAKCREGNTIGPVCRVGGEVEESILQGYANKYHDGFLGHAYVGEWVNLGALTTNSDLKNDYGDVSVTLDGRRPVETGSKKVGSLIGDHTKTSVGTLFNTGSYVGAMAVILATGEPLPKFLPSFGWFLGGVVTKGFGRKKLYETATVAMARRGCQWSGAEQAMWDAVFELTAGPRDEAIRKGRRAMQKRR